MTKISTCSECGAPFDKWGAGDCIVCGAIRRLGPLTVGYGGAPTKFMVVNRKRGKRGPERGKIARFEESDLNLCPIVDAIIQNKKISRTEACRILAEEGRIDGKSTIESKITRLSRVHKRWSKSTPDGRKLITQNAQKTKSD